MSEAKWILIAATLSGTLGIWLLLPRGAARGRPVGAALTALALGLWAWQLPGFDDWPSGSLFLILAGLTVTAAVATVVMRNPVYSAAWFGLTLLGTSGLLLFIGALFPAVAVVVVCAGGIPVTFLFVLKTAQPEGPAPCDRASWEALVSAATGVLVVSVLWTTIAAASTARETPLLYNYLIVGASLFGIGTIGLLSRRNMVVMFLSAQMTLPGALLSMAAWGRLHDDFGGRVLALLAIAVAAAEAAVAVAVILSLFRHSGELDVALWGTRREDPLEETDRRQDV